jgi:hypothetical protein
VSFVSVGWPYIRFDVCSGVSGMTVEEHVHVCLDEDGNPVRVYHHEEINRAKAAVESESYRDQDIVDVRLDVPLYEPGDGS